VWFAGAHSDVGGGYATTGLSDATLLWMATEAHRQGLVFDAPLLTSYVGSGSKAVRHNPLKPVFRAHNLVIKAKMLIGLTKTDAFEKKKLRRLDLPGRLSVRVASTAAEDLAAGDYKPSNLAAYATTTTLDGVTEAVQRLPKASRAEAAALVEPLGKPV
jgi:hypothetical protein